MTKRCCISSYLPEEEAVELSVESAVGSVVPLVEFAVTSAEGYVVALEELAVAWRLGALVTLDEFAVVSAVTYTVAFIVAFTVV